MLNNTSDGTLTLIGPIETKSALGIYLNLSQSAIRTAIGFINDLIEVIGPKEDPIITVPTQFLIRGHVANWAFVSRLVRDSVEESGRLWRVSPRTLVDPQHPVEGGVYMYLRDG